MGRQQNHRHIPVADLVQDVDVIAKTTRRVSPQSGAQPSAAILNKKPAAEPSRGGLRRGQVNHDVYILHKPDPEAVDVAAPPGTGLRLEEGACADGKLGHQGDPSR